MKAISLPERIRRIRGTLRARQPLQRRIDLIRSRQKSADGNDCRVVRVQAEEREAK